MTDFKNYIYVASCVFTRENPALSVKIQNYLKKRFRMQIIRCCVPKYKLNEFTVQMPEWLQQRWRDTPDFKSFTPDNKMVYVCHNCSAIFQETMPEIKRVSLWELILSDPEYPFPDYLHEKMTVQDCWRSYDNFSEQKAVRSLLKKMNIDIVEQEENYEKTKFCGISLYKPAPGRNLKLAPRRFVENADGKFISHTKEQQIQLMREHCKKITTDKVVAYCHYCVKGLELGEKHVKHLASLLFDV
ncbi:hypothetical protein KM792_05815 [Clostridium tyrobutyricum]|jgi:hypothetical protein|uniref:hypothetical protein n=1 Tax=Clostridium tyrobutyricum TaxID=1519 RepID=UPI0003135696|nr:hypothetical protein [Clostridium tyrobutyricum]MBV4417832.1 hypothetical protein [Clostridium tyrobutyricum]MBV4422098.1 hypothetical protein [Clostridium tyrobutyricum]MBV4425154.1 hypothetical protein [Clostridium tyrobutyricum]MBV4428390.1 hypothetical protein [Clostridium tyrobutyricum]MBV4431212.1 hypothetical protein [Clostridium tyrobutyricum]